MPAHITAADLKQMAANPEELAAAKLAIEKASPAEKRSKMGSMVSWLKANPQPEVSASRGADREKWLMKFMVHQSRCRLAKKEITSSREIGRASQKFHDVHKWAWEEMDLNMGAAKGNAWRQCGLLPTEACPLTKSTCEDLKVYVVPVAWQRMTDTDLKNFVFSCRSDASEKEFEQLQADADDDQPLVKKEPMTAAEQKVKKDIDEKLAEEEFVNRINVHLQKLTTLECEARSVQSKRAAVVKINKGKAKYTEFLSEDIDKHVKALMKLSSTFKTLASASYDRKGVGVLKQTWESAQASHTVLMEWADKFDLRAAKTKKQKTLMFPHKIIE